MKKMIITLALVLGYTATANASFMEDATGVTELKKQILDLALDLNIAQSKIKLLENKIESLESQQKLTTNNILDLYTSQIPRQAYFNPAEEKYSVVYTNGGGIFSIACKGIKKYGSGSRVSLNFVNFLDVNFTNIEVKIIYSTTTPWDNLEEFNKNKKETTEKIAKIKAGTNKKIKVTFPEYPPEQLKYLGVSLMEDGIEYKVSN